MMKRKRKQVNSKKDAVVNKKAKIPPKKGKKTEKPDETTSILDEKAEGKKEAADKKAKSGKKELKLFNDKNLDVDLHKDPDQIVGRRIRLTASLILACKTIQMLSEGSTIDWAAIVIEKKLKDSRCFDFNLPLSVAPRMIAGLQEIMKQNPKYFNQA